MSTQNNETLQEENERLRQENQELREMVEKLTDQVDDLARRVSMLEGNQTALEEQIENGSSDSQDETPTPEGDEPEESDRVAPLAATPDEELKDDCASLTLRIAAEIHRNAHRYAEAGNGGKKTFNRKRDLRALLRSALDMDRIYWKQIHRAMEYLDNYSPEFTHRKTERHGHILVTPSSVVQRRRG